MYYINKIKRIIQDKSYRDYRRVHRKYGRIPRHVEQSIEIGGVRWAVPDVASFLSTWGNLVINSEYVFFTDSTEPIILDFGGNIGISAYCFAKMYPNATIHVFEADPYIFTMLERNVSQFDNGRIYLHNRAVWDSVTTISFHSDKADGGRCVESNQNEAVSIDTVDAEEVLEKFEHVDMLKIDIEGAESRVIPRIKDQLEKVDRIFVEYHSETEKKQELAAIIGTLSSNFRLYVKPVHCPDNPFRQIHVESGFDLQMNIYGIRD